MNGNPPEEDLSDINRLVAAQEEMALVPSDRLWQACLAALAARSRKASSPHWAEW
jgi:hypothetical protein